MTILYQWHFSAAGSGDRQNPWLFPATPQRLPFPHTSANCTCAAAALLLDKIKTIAQYVRSLAALSPWFLSSLNLTIGYIIKHGTL
ncbi:MAG: hypothetical protein ACYCQM_05620 [Acidithiobacillus sp.]